MSASPEREGTRGEVIGYVVVEWNQASGQPRVSSYHESGDVFRERDEALLILGCTRAEMKSVGRRETYDLGEVRIVEATDDEVARVLADPESDRFL